MAARTALDRYTLQRRSPPNDDNDDDNDYYNDYYYYYDDDDDDDDIITIIYNNNMVAMSISSRSRARERFFYFISGRSGRWMPIHSFVRRPSAVGSSPAAGPVIRDDAQIHNNNNVYDCHYTTYYNNIMQYRTYSDGGRRRWPRIPNIYRCVVYLLQTCTPSRHVIIHCNISRRVLGSQLWLDGKHQQFRKTWYRV